MEERKKEKDINAGYTSNLNLKDLTRKILEKKYTRKPKVPPPNPRRKLNRQRIFLFKLIFLSSIPTIF